MSKRYKSSDEVIQALQRAADAANDESYKARSTLRRNGQDVSYQHRNITPRNVAGIFKVRGGYFTNSSGKFYFDPVTLQATSYHWWDMLKVYKGKLVRNCCNYSMETAKHQNRLDKALEVLGITADVTVNTKANIGNVEAWKRALLSDYAEARCALAHGTKAKRDWHRKNLRRVEKNIATMAKLTGAKFTDAQLTAAVAKEEMERINRLAWQRERRTKKRETAKAVAEAPTLKLVNGGGQ